MEDLVLDYRSPRTWVTLAAFIIVVCVIGGIVGISSAPGPWYEALTKAPWNPPNWVFAPAWLTLYVLIGIAGARTFSRNPASGTMILWILQMILNWAWSPTWFTLHLLWPAFILIMVILALIIAFIVKTWNTDRVSAWLFVPYALWVAFASTLNLAIAILN